MNVISILDKACSGKTTCEYLVDKEMYETKPCPPGMAARNSYLEVNHKCIKGMEKIVCIMSKSMTLKCISDIFCCYNGDRVRIYFYFVYGYFVKGTGYTYHRNVSENPLHFQPP